MRAPKFSARLRMSELMAYAHEVAKEAEEKAARRAETACLLCLVLLLLLAACNPPSAAPGPPPPAVPGHHLHSDWYEVDSTTD